jgi:hypothetical protein
LSDTSLRDWLDERARENARREAQWNAMVQATISLIAAELQRMRAERQPPGHGGGGRAARRRGEARKRRAAYVARKVQESPIAVAMASAVRLCRHQRMRALRACEYCDNDEHRRRSFSRAFVGRFYFSGLFRMPPTFDTRRYVSLGDT